MKRISKTIRTFALLFAIVLMLLPTVAFAAPPAAGGDPVAVVTNLSDYIFTLVRTVGILATLWGVVQIGMSFSNHDASQRMQGFLIIAGALLIVFAKEILQLIGAM